MQVVHRTVHFDLVANPRPAADVGDLLVRG
jgi:hypothetical protein